MSNHRTAFFGVDFHDRRRMFCRVPPLSMCESASLESSMYIKPTRGLHKARAPLILGRISVSHARVSKSLFYEEKKKNRDCGIRNVENSKSDSGVETNLTDLVNQLK